MSLNWLVMLRYEHSQKTTEYELKDVLRVSISQEIQTEFEHR